MKFLIDIRKVHNYFVEGASALEKIITYKFPLTPMTLLASLGVNAGTEQNNLKYSIDKTRLLLKIKL